MLLWELTEIQLSTERRRSVQAGGYRIVISTHVEKQRQDREVSINDIAVILTRLNRVKHKINAMPVYEKFIVTDPRSGISLGMMRLDDPGVLKLNTVYPGTGQDPDKTRISVR
jgi:hypothetical protein